MKQPVYLKSFEYSIPASENYFNDRSNLHGDYLKMHSPLVKISIDFVNKCLFLESNGIQSKALSSKTELSRFAFEKERIKVNAHIYCGLDISLSGSSNEEMVFLLEGIVDDGESKNPCSGLIVIDGRTNIRESGGKEWDIRISLYDNNNDEREIKLDLMMYSVSQNAELN
ncbi:MAG TPA: hypothetical protein VGZ90_04115 [Puia sp.]|jgi:hypothetical protein|nr:hypothetical protein [Puia sp.]